MMTSLPVSPLHLDPILDFHVSAVLDPLEVQEQQEVLLVRVHHPLIFDFFLNFDMLIFMIFELAKDACEELPL